MIDETLRHLIETAYQDMEGVLGGRKGYRLRHDELTKKFKTAIYEIGLGVMPKPKTPDTSKADWADKELQQVKGFNSCLSEVKEAWAKACGVAEK